MWQRGEHVHGFGEIGESSGGAYERCLRDGPLNVRGIVAYERCLRAIVMRVRRSDGEGPKSDPVLMCFGTFYMLDALHVLFDHFLMSILSTPFCVHADKTSNFVDLLAKVQSSETKN